MASDFALKYTQANLPRGAAAYESSKFLGWLKQLQAISSAQDLSIGILTAILVAQRRGDAVGLLFSEITKNQSESQVKETFSIVREAISLAAPFVGLPNTMPACFGTIGVLKDRGIASVEHKTRIPPGELDYAKIGSDTNKAIYRGVGNSEVGVMIAQYLPDLSSWANTSIFGYLCGGSTVLPLKDVEIFVASAIIGLGASRQARSHCKAALQLGNSPDAMAAIDAVAQEIAVWNGTPLPERLDLHQLVKEVNGELAKLGVPQV